ncbi:PREDICTED: protein D7-like [Rhagoletis zephyria]|uniref:protein D7-like n=1 Tax=Rhagoletis zephyria TaxID=28612 RepID=UPI0008116DC5|nr:PREDICTED: protein D7-like [Rhagoletis zephyria]
MFSIENDSDVVVCPYNKAHRLLRKRLQPHLIKCRQNYPQLELQKCPFNATHHIPEPEFALHVTNCPDRKLITQYKYDTVEPKEEERVRHAPIECEENWDDTEVEDYNPQKYIDQKNVLRKPFGVPPSQRKEFIKQERKRLGDNESYSDSDEEEETEKIETSPKKAIKEENFEEAEALEPKREISPSPPREVKSRYERRPRTRSRSPVSAYYRRIHGRESQSPPPPPRYRASPVRERSPIYNNRRAPSPAAYDIDDDPYYNGGRGSSNEDTSTSKDYGRPRYEADLYTPDAYRAPPLVAYPTRMPSYGRGAFRGYPYDRRNDSRSSDFRN